MRAVAVIPARMGSSRFPGKPLAPILSRSMIEHVYRRVALSDAVDDVIVATCDEEIVAAVERFGGRAVMTSDAHQRASDRVAEAAEGLDADVVVMVQGDEPMVRPEQVADSVAPFADPDVRCVNLFARIASEAEYLDRNTIKVAIDRAGDALYFSREPIPTAHAGGFGALTAFKQVCVIPFRSDALALFASLEPTPLEVAESVDMLRFLEHGVKVRMVETHVSSHAVDTPADLVHVERLMADDPLLARYA